MYSRPAKAIGFTVDYGRVRTRLAIISNIHDDKSRIDVETDIYIHARISWQRQETKFYSALYSHGVISFDDGRS